MPTTFQEWKEVAEAVWMVIVTLAIPGIIWLFKTGRLIGRKEGRQVELTRRAGDKMDNLTERIEREVHLKVDKAMHDQLEQRLTYVEQTLNRRVEYIEKKQDDCAGRLSDNMGKISVDREGMRNYVHGLDIRVTRLEVFVQNLQPTSMKNGPS